MHTCEARCLHQTAFFFEVVSDATINWSLQLIAAPILGACLTKRETIMRKAWKDFDDSHSWHLKSLLDPSNSALTARCCSQQRAAYNSITDAISAGSLKIKADGFEVFQERNRTCKAGWRLRCVAVIHSCPLGNNSNVIYHI